MPNHLNSRADRILKIAQTLTNPVDLIASNFAEDLKALAAREVTPLAILSDAGPLQIRKAALGTAFKKAFPLSYEPSFDRLIFTF